MDVTTATPAAIDTQLAEIQHEQAAVAARIASARTAQLHWQRATNPAKLVIARAQQADNDLPRLRAEYAALDARRAPLDNEYVRRGGWTRYYLVNNPDGHVHSHTHCSTCRVTTQFKWLTDMSGGTRESVVELAGERACTVCFPDAPVDALRRRSAFQSDAEVERAQRDAATAADRAARKAKKDAAALTNPDGTPLVVPWLTTSKETLRTERAAWIRLVDDMDAADAYGHALDAADTEAARLIVAALAHKLQETETEIRRMADAKLAARRKRNR